MVIFKVACPLMVGLALVSGASFVSLAEPQSQGDGSRQIVLDEFTKARPTATPSQTSKRPAPAASRKRPTYRRAGALIVTTSTRPALSEELGITVWRLRQSRQSDGGARVLVMESSATSQWTPERIEADTPLKVNDRVRISIESPRAGYLYVIDREQYADGSLGDAYLIFPTRRTRGGDNRVRPGKLIDIPAQEDNPSYLTLVPSNNRSDQTAEVLSFIVTPEPLAGLPIGDSPLKVSKSDIAKWERTWSSDVERFEMEGGAGRAWTNEEKAASAIVSGRLLTQEEPAPQTVYRISGRGRSAILVTVPLRYVK